MARNESNSATAQDRGLLHIVEQIGNRIRFAAGVVENIAFRDEINALEKPDRDALGSVARDLGKAQTLLAELDELRRDLQSAPEPGIRKALDMVNHELADPIHGESPEFVRGATFALSKLRDDLSALLNGTDDAEEFLRLIALANLRDRLHALKVRDNQGLAAAIRYLENCLVQHPEPDELLSQRETLAARCEALGYELFETADGRQLVLDGTEAVFISRSDADDSLEEWLTNREAEYTVANKYHEPSEHGLRDRAGLLGLELMKTGDSERPYAIAEGARIIANMLTARDASDVLAEHEAKARKLQQNGPRPEPFGSHAVRELERLNLIVQGIETLAHDAAKNEDTSLDIVMEVIEREAGLAVEITGGEWWEKVKARLQATSASSDDGVRVAGGYTNE